MAAYSTLQLDLFHGLVASWCIQISGCAGGFPELGPLRFYTAALKKLFIKIVIVQNVENFCLER